MSAWIDDGNYIYRDGDKYTLIRGNRNGAESFALAHAADGSPTNGNQYVEFTSAAAGQRRLVALQKAVEDGDGFAEGILCRMDMGA